MGEDERYFLDWLERPKLKWEKEWKLRLGCWVERNEWNFRVWEIKEISAYA